MLHKLFLNTVGLIILDINALKSGESLYCNLHKMQFGLRNPEMLKMIIRPDSMKNYSTLDDVSEAQFYLNKSASL